MGAPCEARRTLLRRGRAVIFVTVGAQAPFDRLIRAVDEWAVARGRSDVFAQIGSTDFLPKSISAKKFMDPLEFRKCVETADVIVAHAGMGSIITALECGKPIIVMPRRGSLKETRNDHQVATASYLSKHGRVTVAMDEEELIGKLDNVGSPQEMERISQHASPRLIATIRNFIEGKPYAAELMGANTANTR
jgi:UDP-N-acetylglucosamine transferase subunit ALG13